MKNAPEENLPAMVVAKLLQFVKALTGRKWTDQEIVEDLCFLQEELQASFDQLTYHPSILHLTLVRLTSTPPNWNRAICHGHHPIVATIFGEKMPRN